MTVLYGIKNCDTVKKARKWLDNENIEYRFHDFRADGLDQAKITEWLSTIGSESLINKRSTTWKQLSDETKQSIVDGDEQAIIAQLSDNPTLIKRPVVETSNSAWVGFKEADFATTFK